MKVCLERSVAKTLLTLDRQTGKSTEEYAAVKALLFLSVEPVMSSESKSNNQKYRTIRTAATR